jgi:hypothetical protein
MDYKAYLLGVLSGVGYLGTDIEVTNEIAYDVPGKTVVVVKYLPGSNYRESVIQPIQISVYTDDVATTKAQLELFTKAYSNTSYLDGFSYVQQVYSTPFVLGNFDMVGTNFNSHIVISGTLVISENVSEIKRVYIDGIEYETASRALSYVAQIDNQRVGTDTLNTTQVTIATVRFTCSMVSKGSELGMKLRQLRTGALDINTTFTVKLVFSDNEAEETYTMKLDSNNINSENQSLPNSTVSFIK